MRRRCNTKLERKDSKSESLLCVYVHQGRVLYRACGTLQSLCGLKLIGSPEGKEWYSAYKTYIASKLAARLRVSCAGSARFYGDSPRREKSSEPREVSPHYSCFLMSIDKIQTSRKSTSRERWQAFPRDAYSVLAASEESSNMPLAEYNAATRKDCGREIDYGLNRRAFRKPP